MVRTQPFYPLFLENLQGIKENNMLSLHIFGSFFSNCQELKVNTCSSATNSEAELP